MWKYLKILFHYDYLYLLADRMIFYFLKLYHKMYVCVGLCACVSACVSAREGVYYKQWCFRVYLPFCIRISDSMVTLQTSATVSGICVYQLTSQAQQLLRSSSYWSIAYTPAKMVINRLRYQLINQYCHEKMP